DRPVPALGALLDRLVPLADLFMLVLLSRPHGGSLRNTWVTPATLGLCTAVVALAIPACALLIASGATAAVAGGLLMIPFAGDVLGRPDPPKRRGRHRAGDHLVGLGVGAHQRRVDHPRGDRVDGDAVASQLHAQGAGQADHSRLGGRVVGLAGVAEVGARADV